MINRGVIGVRKDLESTTKERYNRSYAQYVDSQFTYNSHVLLKRLCEEGDDAPNMMKVPLYPIITQITKIMMMNELELLFFGSTIQEMHWKITESCLKEYLDQVTDITPEIPKPQGFLKNVQLSLLLIAYIVKLYLNEDYNLVNFKIREICKKNFEKMYQVWVVKFQDKSKFNPKNLNTFFMQLQNKKCVLNKNIVDYNKLVKDYFRQQESQERREEMKEGREMREMREVREMREMREVRSLRQPYKEPERQRKQMELPSALFSQDSIFLARNDSLDLRRNEVSRDSSIALFRNDSIYDRPVPSAPLSFMRSNSNASQLND